MRVAIANDKDVERAPSRHAESWKRRLRDSRDAALAKVTRHTGSCVLYRIVDHLAGHTSLISLGDSISEDSILYILHQETSKGSLDTAKYVDK
jgi:hypothetical protein